MTQGNLDRALGGERVVAEAFSGDGGLARRVLEVEYLPVGDGERIVGVVVRSRDVTGQRREHHELQDRERALSTLMGNLPGMAYRCANDADWTIEFVSAGCADLTGYPASAFVGSALIAFADLTHPDDRARGRAEVDAAIARGAHWNSVYRITTAAGEVKWVWERGVALKHADGSVEALEGFMHDVTAAHEAEARLAAATVEWSRTFDAMNDSIAVFDREGRVVRCNAATLALTGRSLEDIGGRLCHEVFHGTREFHADCPQRRAFASGHVESTLLRQDGRFLRLTFTPEIDAAGAVIGGVHVVSDVTDLKQAERDVRESLRKQQRITDGVISALARSVETRDPYTAGHQRRVGELAGAIALVLGNDAETIRHLQIAGMLHDVGKLAVPAEILTRPGRLSDNEFTLIQAHSEAGHEILKSAEFDFPLAEIVLQHHERLDGTGYPAGLMDEAILPEARILAVADVVEAMVSHRPYRAALPVEDALAEIEDGAGSRYDAAACDAAVRLFREQAFTFSESQ